MSALGTSHDWGRPPTITLTDHVEEIEAGRVQNRQSRPAGRRTYGTSSGVALPGQPSQQPDETPWSF